MIFPWLKTQLTKERKLILARVSRCQKNYNTIGLLRRATISRLWLTCNEFWAYISMPNIRPLFPCVVKKMSGNLKFNQLHSRASLNQTGSKLCKINKPWPKSNQFWRWSRYISIPNFRPFLQMFSIKCQETSRGRRAYGWKVIWSVGHLGN